jgi:hypothetical protein
MRIWILTSALFFTCFSFARSGSSGSCVEDKDCKKKELCNAGRCVKLSKKDSLLEVSLEAWVANAAVSIDGVPMGHLPWQGVVSAGEHTIKVEAPGYQTLELTGLARAKKREQIQLKLEPAAGAPASGSPPQQASSELPPLPPPPFAQDDSLFPSLPEDPETEEGAEEEDEEEGEKPPGMLAVGLFGSGGYGTAMWGSSIKRPVASVFGGGLFSVRFLTDPLWFELGVTGSYGAHFGKDWPDVGDFKFTELHVGLLPRILFSIVDDFFYLGAEVEAGIAISSYNYILVQARGDLAFMVNEWLEIRVNPLGFEWLQEMKGKGAVIGYTGNVGAAFRFL